MAKRGWLARNFLPDDYKNMNKKLTITVDEKVYRGLYLTMNERKISRFIENLVKPHVLHPNLKIAYRKMALDEKREDEANEWSESLIGDVSCAER